MKIVSQVEEVREQVRAWRKEGLSIGFVPTMGYLHEGHKSLMECARSENDKVIVSIFVNPIQFGPSEDLESYPRDKQRDEKLCKDAGVALIFRPEVDQMYDATFSTYVDMDTLTKGLCGKTRPTHFRGVCTVVAKLFHIVTPDRAYFGQKDAQQLAVIRHMVNDLNFGIQIVGCPIIRESDGLAKSSRNTYLNEEERKAALILSQSLALAKHMYIDGERDANVIRLAMQKKIKTEPLATIDYIEIVDWTTLESVTTLEKSFLVAIAVYIGKTRLIDNFIIE